MLLAEMMFSNDSPSGLREIAVCLKDFCFTVEPIYLHSLVIGRCEAQRNITVTDPLDVRSTTSEKNKRPRKVNL